MPKRTRGGHVLRVGGSAKSSCRAGEFLSSQLPLFGMELMRRGSRVFLPEGEEKEKSIQAYKGAVSPLRSPVPSPRS